MDTTPFYSFVTLERLSERFKLRKLESTVTPRYEHAMVLHGFELIVFGGAGLVGNMNDIEYINIGKSSAGVIKN